MACKGIKEVTFKEINLAAELSLTKKVIYEAAVLYTGMCVAVEEKYEMEKTMKLTN